eukprot:jgi/Astpho2/9630/Aster-x0405
MCSRKADQKLAWLQVQAERIQALSKENATLIEELKRLQSSLHLVAQLTDENRRLMRDNKALSQSLESMVADHSALSERLINAALPVRTESVEVDIFEQAFGPDSSPPHGQALKPLLPAPQPVTPRTASRDLAMSDEMAKRRGQAEIQSDAKQSCHPTLYASC